MIYDCWSAQKLYILDKPVSFIVIAEPVYGCKYLPTCALVP